MAITRRIPEFTPDPFGLSAAGNRCFHCGKFLEDPAVVWYENDGQTIYFHGPCCLDWTARIMRDALELKYKWFKHKFLHRANQEEETLP